MDLSCVSSLVDKCHIMSIQTSDNYSKCERVKDC